MIGENQEPITQAPPSPGKENKITYNEFGMEKYIDWVFKLNIPLILYGNSESKKRDLLKNYKVINLDLRKLSEEDLSYFTTDIENQKLSNWYTQLIQSYSKDEFVILYFENIELCFDQMIKRVLDNIINTTYVEKDNFKFKAIMDIIKSSMSAGEVNNKIILPNNTIIVLSLKSKSSIEDNTLISSYLGSFIELEIPRIDFIDWAIKNEIHPLIIATHEKIKSYIITPQYDMYICASNLLKQGINVSIIEELLFRNTFIGKKYLTSILETQTISLENLINGYYSKEDIKLSENEILLLIVLIGDKDFSNYNYIAYERLKKFIIENYPEYTQLFQATSIYNKTLKKSGGMYG